MEASYSETRSRLDAQVHRVRPHPRASGARLAGERWRRREADRAGRKPPPATHRRLPAGNARESARAATSRARAAAPRASARRVGGGSREGTKRERQGEIGSRGGISTGIIGDNAPRYFPDPFPTRIILAALRAFRRPSLYPEPSAGTTSSPSSCSSPSSDLARHRRADHRDVGDERFERRSARILGVAAHPDHGPRQGPGRPGKPCRGSEEEPRRGRRAPLRRAGPAHHGRGRARRARHRPELEAQVAIGEHMVSGSLDLKPGEFGIALGVNSRRRCASVGDRVTLIGPQARSRPPASCRA